MLVSKIKPCMSKYNSLEGGTDVVPILLVLGI